MIKKTKVLITGGAGFIGSNLANRLYKKNYNVLVVDDLSKGRKDNLNKSIHLLKQDIRTKRFIKTFEQFQPEYLFHLAAQTNLKRSQNNPKEEFEINFLPIIEILEASKKVRLKKIIFSSSAAVYGHCKVLPIKESTPLMPGTPYGISKLATENYLKYFSEKHSLPYVIFRYANVYGPKQNFSDEGGVVAVFISKMLKGREIQITGNGRQTRDFIFVDDIVDANIKSLNKKIIGVYNIGTAKEVSILVLYNKIKMLTKTKSKVKIDSAIDPGVSRSALSSTLFCKNAGFIISTELKEGLEKTVNYFKNL
jgi:UDP-glucose 4-epimerase